MKIRCAWCEGPIPATARRDAKTCSQACRQAAHRFRRAAPPVPVDAPVADRLMRFAYADPPYPGLAKRYYAHDEVDHKALIERLVDEFPDGWALSTSSKALRQVLALCPDDVRVSAWVKGLSSGGKCLRPRQSWEPVIIRGGRPYEEGVPKDLRDSLVLGVTARPRSHPGALVGMKPPAFSVWVFRQLGARVGDALVDLFPGSGAVTRAWFSMFAPDGAGRQAG